MSFSSDEVNFLVYRYLQESGKSITISFGFLSRLSMGMVTVMTFYWMQYFDKCI